MANVIEQFAIALGLDASGVRGGGKEVSDILRRIKRETEDADKASKQHTKDMADGFREAALSAAKLVAVVVGAGAFRNMFADMVKTNAELGRNAKYLNMSSRELDAMGNMMATVGGKGEDMVGFLGGLQNAITQFRLGTGGEQQMGILRSLGIDTTQNGKIREWKDIMLDLSDKLSGKSGAEQLYIAQALNIPRPVLDVLVQGRKAVSDLYDQMYKASGVTSETTRQAQEAQKAWGQLDAQWKGVGNNLFTTMIPAINELNKGLLGLSTWVNQNQGGITAFFQGLVKIVSGTVEGLGSFGETVNKFFSEHGNSNGWMDTNDRFFDFITGKTSAVGAYARIKPLQDKLSHYQQEYKTSSPARQRDLAMTYGQNYAQELQGEINKIWAEYRKDNPSMPAVAPQGSTQGMARGSLADRNNNPGNIIWGPWAQAHGAVRHGDGKFAYFPDLQTGNSALQTLLLNYQSRGWNTPASIMRRYAPLTDHNDPASYAAFLAKRLGVDVNQRIDLRDPAVMAKMQAGIAKYEGLSTQSLGALYGSSSSTSQVVIQQMNVNSNASNIKQLTADAQDHIVITHSTGMK